MPYKRADTRNLLSESFESLFFHYAKGLVVYANEFLLNKEDAEDIVHDVFVHLWENMDTIDNETAKAYLFRSTQNMCLNYISHLKVRTKYQESIINNNTSLTNDNTDYYVQLELQRFLDEAISSLPPQRRKVFVMNRLEGKLADNIAVEMNISRRTVDKHLQLASKSIKEYISKYMYLLLLLFTMRHP